MQPQISSRTPRTWLKTSSTSLRDSVGIARPCSCSSTLSCWLRFAPAVSPPTSSCTKKRLPSETSPLSGMKGFSLQHREGTKSLLDFFEKALMLGCDEQRYGAAVAAQRAVVQGVFRPVGQAFVVGLVHGVAGELPSTRCREAGYVLFSLRQCFGAEMDAWYFAALSALGAPFTDVMKQDYMARLTAAADGRGVKNVLQSISAGVK